MGSRRGVWWHYALRRISCYQQLPRGGGSVCRDGMIYTMITGGGTGGGANQPKTTRCKNDFFIIVHNTSISCQESHSADFGAHFTRFNSSPKNHFGEKRITPYYKLY